MNNVVMTNIIMMNTDLLVYVKHNKKLSYLMTATIL